ncbi:MAG: ribosome recycling factor [Methylacidiphilales bacterium]|nr:ribosome recycling factor [Candidatus Methylacidiphilales bacterium]MDW8349086.1 ribosome recycling factor [Verrucomicrobiae bacterium]
MSLDEILLHAEEHMEKTVAVTHDEFASVRSGKASADLVNNIPVDAYGTHMKLKELAAITTPDPRLILIQPWDASNVDPIRKAIEESKIGITPVIDGKLIRLPIPPLSQERRQELVKTIKRIAEDGRVAIRNTRRHALEQVKAAQKAGTLTQDDVKLAEKEIQKLTDTYIEKIDQMVASKETELMKV